jgi:hypothetical protein
MGKGLIFSGINMGAGNGIKTIPYLYHLGGCRFLVLLARSQMYISKEWT